MPGPDRTECRCLHRRSPDMRPELIHIDRATWCQPGHGLRTNLDRPRAGRERDQCSCNENPSTAGAFGRPFRHGLVSNARDRRLPYWRNRRHGSVVSGPTAMQFSQFPSSVGGLGTTRGPNEDWHWSAGTPDPAPSRCSNAFVITPVPTGMLDSPTAGRGGRHRSLLRPSKTRPPPLASRA
jgi:hypothetical protein